MNTLLRDLRVFPKKITLYNRKFIYSGIRDYRNIWGSLIGALPAYRTELCKNEYLIALLSYYTNGAGMSDTSIELCIDDEKYFWELIDRGAVNETF